MFNLKMKMYDMRLKYYNNRKRKMVEKSKRYFDNHDLNGYEKYMNKARYYMAKIVQVSRKKEALELI